MANFDVDAQWEAMVAYLDGGGATNLAALDSARPAVYRDEDERPEDLLPLLVVGLTGGQQQRERASGDNRHQTFGTRFHLYMAAKGPDLKTANQRCLAIVSAVINDLAGSGSYVGTDRSTLFAAVVDGWDWDAADQDSLVAQAFMDITATFYRFS